MIAEREIGLVPIDPFIKTHGADENDNSAIDAVCTLLTGLAIEMHIAVDVLHHDSKGGAQGDPGGHPRARRELFPGCRSPALHGYADDLDGGRQLRPQRG